MRKESFDQDPNNFCIMKTGMKRTFVLKIIYHLSPPHPGHKLFEECGLDGSS